MSFFEGFGPQRHAATKSKVGRVFLLLAFLSLAGCGQQRGYVEFGSPSRGGSSFAPTRYYPPPGPPEDPWGPYIREAATRYGVPEQWVRAVMQQESGGQEQAISPVGAMGLMQVMPETYNGLQARYSLGADPFDPHNNILAGTAYIREMYDRFGAPAFLAAYNAGPDRVEAYLAGADTLPDETVNYLASVTPNLGNAVPLTGPLALYASAGGGRSGRRLADAQSLAAGCDLNAAYNPEHPCTSLMRAAAAPAPVQQASVPQTGAGGCDLSAAFDPSHPCTSVGTIAAASQAAAAPAPPAPPVRQVAIRSLSGCDLAAAYDPAHPCTTAGRMGASSPPPAPVRQAMPEGCGADHPCRPEPPVQPVQLASAADCDPDAAYDPVNPCHQTTAANGHASALSARPARAAFAVTDLLGISSAAAAVRPAAPTRRTEPGPYQLAIPERDWAIQVGAFASPALARAVAEGARSQAPGQLRSAAVALPPTSAGGSVLYRARLVNLSASAAANACTNLNRQQLPCVVVQPRRS